MDTPIKIASKQQLYQRKVQPSSPESVGDEDSGDERKASSKPFRFKPSTAIDTRIYRAEADSLKPQIRQAAKPEPQKPKVYAENGAFAAEVEFNRDPARLLRAILNAAEAENLAELVAELAIAPSMDWLSEYLESALQLFGFEQSAAQARESFAASVQALNREYPSGVRSFAASIRFRDAGADLASLFDE
jgi:hypothetical protein